MKKKKSQTLLLAMVFLSMAPLSAGTVYIDPAAGTNGDGSMKLPYNSWESVKWETGTQYLQKRGTVWNRTIKVEASGNQKDLIMLGAYGSGPKPSVITHNMPAFDVSHQDYVNISSFKVVTTGQEGYRLTSGVVGWGGDHNILEDMEIGPTSGHGVYLNSKHHTTVRSCIFHDAGSKDDWDSCDNIHLENCLDYLVEYCVSYDCHQGAVYDASDGSSGFTRGTWRYNIGYRTGRIPNGHNQWSIFKMSGHHPDSEVYLLYNIAYGSFNGPAYALQEELSSVAIGNVAYNCAAGFQQRPPYNIIINNIVMNCREAIYFPQGDFPERMDHNLFYGNGIFGSLTGGRKFKTLEEWQDYSGHDQHSLAGDPRFTDPENHDFRLQEFSPAIDRGAKMEPYGQGISPASQWPEKVNLLKQQAHGHGWEIGAFIFVPD